MKAIFTAVIASLCVGCTTTSNQANNENAEPTTCAKVYSNDLSVTSKQHYFPIRFRKVNDIRVDLRGWGNMENSSGSIFLEPGKHRLELFIVSKSQSALEKPHIIDRQYVDVTVEADKSYELLAFEKQGDEKTLQRGHRFKFEVNREEDEACEGSRIFELPDESIFDEE